MSAAAELLTYTELLRHYAPCVPSSEDEYEKAVRLLGEFMSRGEASLSADEQKFVETLAALLSDYERRTFKLTKASPADVLRELMRRRGMRPKDLWPVFGSKGITSEVLRGKRGISKERAKILADMFCVSAELFI